MFPVVEAGSLHLAFIQRKPEWFDEVQHGAGSEACAARVSGVPVNFGMYKYDVRCHEYILAFPLRAFMTFS